MLGYLAQHFHTDIPKTDKRILCIQSMTSPLDVFSMKRVNSSSDMRKTTLGSKINSFKLSPLHKHATAISSQSAEHFMFLHREREQH